MNMILFLIDLALKGWVYHRGYADSYAIAFWPYEYVRSLILRRRWQAFPRQFVISASFQS